MRYIIGDIHGCYEQFVALLAKLHITEEDKVYILGDAMDRGPEPIKTLQYIMSHKNFSYILGNHDTAFLFIVKRLLIGDLDMEADEALLKRFYTYLLNGGEVTINQFKKLSLTDKIDLVSYLEQSSLYKILMNEASNKTYILVHGGLGDPHVFDDKKLLEDYSEKELVEERMDYSKHYFSDESIYLVSGHTPTLAIEGWRKAEVLQQYGHIALDTGCVFTGVLAAYCIETKQVAYVGEKQGA